MNHQDWIWIKIGAAVATVVTFSYSTFETKDHSHELLDHIIRIEQKLDKVIEGLK